jgi:hypothetical protein
MIPPLRGYGGIDMVIQSSMEETNMTDFQFQSIIKMVLKILKAADSKDAAIKDLMELLPDSEKPTSRKTSKKKSE